MVTFGDQYERVHYRYTPESARVGEATREILVRWFPRALAPVVRNAVYALLDEPVRAAFGFPAAPTTLVRAVDAALKLRARGLARLPASTRLGSPTDEIMLRLRSRDADVAELGPDLRCPMHRG
jgi:hypothetical protein